MSKNFKKLAICLITVLAAVGLTMLFASHHATQTFINGATNGFNINGQYKVDNDNKYRPSMAILSDDNSYVMEWQIVDENNEIFNGTFIATGDPNIYELIAEDGHTCGSMHISYVTKDNKGGLLLVSHDEIGELTLIKFASRPAFIED